MLMGRQDVRWGSVTDRPRVRYDVELGIAALETVGYVCEWERVDTQAAFVAHLQDQDYDLIFADNNLPTFDGLRALSLVRDQGLDTPFILISGTLGEERAIDSLKAGAMDYVMKTRLARLVPWCSALCASATRAASARRPRKPSATASGGFAAWRAARRWASS